MNQVQLQIPENLAEVAEIGMKFPSWSSDPITLEHLKAYASASGDDNPIHQDEMIAKKMGLPGVIAHGMLTMGFLGSYATVLAKTQKNVLKLNCQFKAMTFLGDVITISGFVSSIKENASGKLMVINLVCTKQTGEKTAQGHVEINLQ